MGDLRATSPAVLARFYPILRVLGFVGHRGIQIVLGLGSCLPGTDPISEKNSRTIGKMAKKWVKLGFGVIFLFSANFSYFPGEAETYFLLFRAGGQKWGLYQANAPASNTPQIRKSALNNEFLLKICVSQIF